MSTPVALIIILTLIAGNGFFVALEFALVAADRSKLEELSSQGVFTAKSAVKVLEKLSFHLSGAQLGITVTSLVLGFLADSVVRDLLAPVYNRFDFLAGETASIVVALFVATVFQLVFGELIPKNLAIAKPEALSQALSPVANVLHGIFSPIILLFNGAANAIVRKIGLEPKEELSELIDLEDLGYLAQANHQGNTLEADTAELLARTVRFGDKTAAEALRPRREVEAVAENLTVNEFLDHARGLSHSRFPVIADSIDSIIGQMDISTAIGVPFSHRDDRTVGQVMRSALVVPETKELVEVLADYATSETELAVVVDEHGGTAGIITLEDVLEEIIGEVDDEYDAAEHLTRGAPSGAYYVAGTLHADEILEATGFEMPKGNYETIAGYVLEELGYIPSPGDTFTNDTWRVVVTEMDTHRVATVQLKKVGES